MYDDLVRHRRRRVQCLIGFLVSSSYHVTIRDQVKRVRTSHDEACRCTNRGSS
jgi:hypothetical protein